MKKVNKRRIEKRKGRKRKWRERKVKSGEKTERKGGKEERGDPN